MVEYGGFFMKSPLGGRELSLYSAPISGVKNAGIWVNKKNHVMLTG